MAASRRWTGSSSAVKVAVALVVLAALTGTAGLVPRPALAQDPLPAVAYRQAEMMKMAAAMRVVGAFLKGQGATVSDVAASAAIIREIAGRLVGELFPAGTAIGVGESTARPEIWQQWDMFTERANTMVAAASRLATAAATNDPEAVRGPILDVVRACGACHELFRRNRP